MSIASQITRLTNAKAGVKSSVNTDFNKIGNETVNNYPALIDSTIEEYKKYIPNASVSGSILNIPNAAPFKMKNGIIDGNTYQNSTSGKNLCNITSLTGYQYSAQIPTVPSNAFVINNFDSNNLSYSITNNQYLLGLSNIIELKANTMYTLSCVRNSTESSPRLYVYNYVDNTYTLNSRDLNIGTITLNFTTDQTGIIVLGFAVGNNSNGAIGTISNIQIEEGSTVTNFEPYTGGKPSASPDYPQKIISCGDRTKNLYDKNNFVNGYIDASGIFHNDSTVLANALSDYIKLDNDTDYIFSAKSTIYGLNVALYDENKNFVRRKNVNNNSKNQFNSETESYCRVWSNINQQTTITSDLIEEYEIQLRKGSTILSYEPYGYKIPVNVRSENLFNKNDTNIINNKYLDINGSSIDNNNFLITDYIAIKGNTVYNLTPTKTFSACNCFYDENKTFISGIQISNINKTFTTPLNAKFIRLSVRKIDYIDMLMLVEGSTVPSKYIPYYNQTTNIYLDEPLRKIGNDADYIDFKNGKVVRKIYEIKLDGTRTTGRYIDKTLTNTTRMQYINNPKGYHNDINIFCNQLQGKLVWLNDTEGLYVDNANFVFRINKTKIGETFQSADQYFSNNPLILDYALETPIEESITVPDIPLISGTNIITVDTILETNMTVEYYEDWRIENETPLQSPFFISPPINNDDSENIENQENLENEEGE